VSQTAVLSRNHDRPVEQVTWDEAINDCAQLTAQERTAGRLPTGYEYRLPTEAQWEYASRAGTTTATSFGDGFSSTQSDFDDAAPNDGAGPRPMPALHDPGPGWSVTDPQGPSSGAWHVYRGGSWGDTGRDLRSASRYGYWPEFRISHVGFRVVLTATP